MNNELEIGIKMIKEVNNSEAIVSLQKALNKDPRNPEIHRHLGLAYFNLGHYKEALRHWKTSLELDPTHHQTWWCIGNLYESTNQNSLAFSAYQKAVETSKVLNIIKAKRYEEWVKRVQSKLESNMI